MFMVPEQNFGLLPPNIAKALTNPNCILKSPVDYFPNQFTYDKFESLKYNQRALIEFLVEKDVRIVYEAAKHHFTKE